MRDRWYVIVLTLGIAFVTASTNSWAAGPTTGRKMLDKLGRGTSNAVAGVAELPYAIDVELNANRNFVAATTVGLVKGTLLAVRRIGVGLFEIVTFWAPVPRDYAPVLPEAGYFGGPS